MEGRATSAPASVRVKAPRPGRTRIVLIALLAIAVLGAAFAALRWNAGRAEADAEFDAYTTVPATEPAAPAAGPAPAAVATAAPVQGGAMIVEDTANDPTRALDGLPVAAAEPAPAGHAAASETGAASAAAPAPAKPAAASASASASQRKARATPANGKRAPADNSDLLATLMGIIKRDEKPAEKHESMDSLIAKIQAEDSKNAAETDAAFDAIDSRSASTSSNVQTQLRKCPGANTMAGLECRKKVCAALTGKDPACPAH
ncbi:hypothetical protein JR065_05795 [Xanthomonas sp. AmX2]|uniref:hypothetical protein n=1 Tax=Xanthomonas sp. TaxID=29446 RepID=UPI001981DBD3|nr:hypothetical protein [Xanthomonas sp.]MBN6149844.1 hypothetical protein [Xanthomonas sp.]